MAAWTLLPVIVYVLLLVPGAKALERHGGPVTDLAVWPEDSQAGYVSSGFDGRILRWTAGLNVAEVMGHLPFPLDRVSTQRSCASGICSLAAAPSPDAKGTAVFQKFFDDGEGFQVANDGSASWRGRPLEGEYRGVIDVQAFENRVVVIQRGLRPLLIDTQEGTTAELPGSGIAASSVARAGPSKALIGSVNGDLALIGLNNGQSLSRLHLHDAPVLKISVSEDNMHAVTAGANGTLTSIRIGQDGLFAERIIAQFGFPILAMVLDERRDRAIIGHKDGHLEAVPLGGSTTLKAPPNPAVLFAQDKNESESARLFRACAACHSFAPDGGNKAGPTFAGLFGRKAGSVPGYPYSQALLDADLVWDENTLSDLFERGPEHYLPGTTMPLQRLPDAGKRALLIGYLKQRSERPIGDASE